MGLAQREGKGWEMKEDESVRGKEWKSEVVWGKRGKGGDRTGLGDWKGEGESRNEEGKINEEDKGIEREASAVFNSLHLCILLI